MVFHRIFRFHNRECDFSASYYNHFDEKVCTQAYHWFIPKHSIQFIHHRSNVPKPLYYLERAYHIDHCGWKPSTRPDSVII